MLKEIIFDMDKTIAGLYDVPHWLEMLRAYDPTPYIVAEPMWDMMELVEILDEIRRHGITISIVSWLSKDSTKEYDTAVRKAKKEWLDKFGFPYDHCHLVKYGTPKANCVRKRVGYHEAILIDDDFRVRDSWHLGRTYDPTEEDIIVLLRDLLEEICVSA